MLALALLVVSIAVADSLNPGTIAPALYFATGARPARKTLAFAAGVFAVNLVGGTALLLGPGRLALGALPHPGAGAKQLAELGLGAVALVGAAVLWLVRERLRDRYARAARRTDRASLLVGAAIAAVELPTALPYFAAIAAAGRRQRERHVPACAARGLQSRLHRPRAGHRRARCRHVRPVGGAHGAPASVSPRAHRGADRGRAADHRTRARRRRRERRCALNAATVTFLKRSGRHSVRVRQQEVVVHEARAGACDRARRSRRRPSLSGAER